MAFFQNVRPQFHGPRLVVAVHVAEGRREHIPAQAVQGFVNGEHVFRGGVEFIGRLIGVIHAVFLAADHARFHFQNDFVLRTEFEKLFGECDVLVQGQLRGI